MTVADGWPDSPKSPAEVAGLLLFAGDIDWWHNACVNWTKADWELYATGYKRAADVLVDHLASSQGELDTLIYPLVYIYRQHLELRLKYLVRDGRLLQDKRGSIPIGHPLMPLWRELRAVLVELWPKEDRADLDAIEQYLDQFSRYDPRSTSFRYPPKGDGSPSIGDLQHVNVRRLAEIMNSVSMLLDGIACGMDEYLSYKFEMEVDDQLF